MSKKEKGQETETINEVETKVADPKKPWVLISGPVTAYKLSVISEYVRHVKKLTYPNFAVLLCDNSETDDMYQSLKPVEKWFSQRGQKFFVVMTPHRPFIRSRLVEGENLAYDVIFKREDLTPYQLSIEDEAKVRELQKIDFQYLLGLEQDVLPPPDAIERLMENDKDAVSAVYFNSKVYVDPNTGQQNQQFIPMIWNWGNKEVMEAEILVDTNIDYLTPSRCEQTAATGIGCVLIKKETLAAMTNIVDYRPLYNASILRYKNSGGKLSVEDLKQKMVAMANSLVETSLIDTMSGRNTITVEEVELEVNGEKGKVELPVQFQSWGFRYQSGKFACSDMYMSLDINRGGKSLWFDSRVWCKHLHQVWDTQTMGER